MPSDSGERRPTRPQQVGAPPPEPEHLPCPRCDSTNTKFCYYNNYNFSQPRHFCKSCRRYWTHGGTLRDIPVGGGSRKNAKRSRPTTTTSSAAAQDYHHHHHISVPTATPVLFGLSSAAAEHGLSVPFVGDVKPGLNGCGSFTSLLSTQAPGFLALGGFGLGLGSGFEEMGFGLGRAVWPISSVGDGGAGGAAGGANMIGSTWQLESGEGGFITGEDCFSLPDLAISTPGNGLK
ncbi:dof zinc finger protein DOF3.4 [Camellia sinensis]|uniref:Dof zinc finger protein n=1 Tax=Camellia sinensis var. sinensis TaxID=542762 RepID=A0A4S4D6I2_CAMSN|nr:dof zinc finger protein DOF3.4 [Camellia sinensis]THF98010.1 hypothetical protein TEA_007559 [Camellia sinensis var. sinensis]